MSHRIQPRRIVALLACTASLAGMAVGIAPAAASAKAMAKCPDKVITFQQEGQKPARASVRLIRLQGAVNCATAYRAIAGALAGKPVGKWLAVPANFATPDGLGPLELKNGSKTIRYAVPT